MKQTLLVLLAFVSLSCTKKTAPATTVTRMPGVDSAFQGLPLHPLRSKRDLDPLIAKMGNATVILLGEATHGTAEFYDLRAEITKRLITEKGFTAIATEGDWADGVRVDDFINAGKKDSAQAVRVLQLFDRWPSFLWANTEFMNFMLWLNRYNADQSVSTKITFHGTDLFSISDAADTMYNRVNDDGIKKALQQFRNCFRVFNNDEQLYSKPGEKGDCSQQATQLVALTKKYIERDTLSSLFFLQAALAIYNGERYYHSLRNRVDAWNIRDNHMAESIKRIAGVKGKVIVWLHNTHAGDAFYSSTHWHARSSVGEILRKSMTEKNIYLLGFGTYSGTVTAAPSWGGNIEQMQLANAETGTWEQTLHSMGAYDKYIMFDETKDNPQLQPKWIYTRSIGVLYHSNERSGMNLSRMAKRFDAYIFIDHTTALHPLQVRMRRTAGKIDD